jgi:hypothetical protein
MPSTSTATIERKAGFLYLADGSETPGRTYSRVRAAASRILKSGDPKHKTLLRENNAQILRLKDVGANVVQDNRFLANLSAQYGNDAYIGLLLMPDIPATNISGEYPIYGKRDRLALPDASMVGRATANEITDSRSKGTYSCQPRALKNHVDVLTLRNQVAPLDEMVDLTEAVSELIALDREVQIATALTNSNNYYAGNVQTITTGSRWDDSGGGNPILNIQTAIASLWHGRGPSKVYAWCSLPVWNALARNQQILDLFKYSGGSPGLAQPDQIASYFGIDGIFVSKAREDNTNIGQSATYGRIWSPTQSYFGVTRVSERASIRNISYGYTLRFGNVTTRVWFDPTVSTEGGYFAQVSTVENIFILANDAAALMITPTNAYA